METSGWKFPNADKYCGDIVFASTSLALTEPLPQQSTQESLEKLSPDITGRQLFPSGRMLFQGLHLPVGNLITQGVVDIYNYGLQTFFVKMYKALDFSNAIYGEHILYLRTAPCP